MKEYIVWQFIPHYGGIVSSNWKCNSDLCIKLQNPYLAKEIFQQQQQKKTIEISHESLQITMQGSIKPYTIYWH